MTFSIPPKNVVGGVKYLRHLLDRYDGDRQLTLAAYNAGEAAVERAQGIPPYPETEDYVSRVSRFYAVSGRSASSEQAEDDASNAIRPRIVVYVEPQRPDPFRDGIKVRVNALAPTNRPEGFPSGSGTRGFLCPTCVFHSPDGENEASKSGRSFPNRFFVAR